MHVTVELDEELVARSEVVTVCVDLDRFVKRVIPDWLREKLAPPTGG